MGNTAKQCRLGLFQDSDFEGDLEDSKSTSGGTLCIFGSHTFVPISWMCKKQTSVSHSSTESEIISKQCRLGLFQDSDFAGDLKDSKSASGGTLCVFGSHTFVPISWMCEKKTSVSHSSTESELILLDEGLRLDGITALDLWDLIIAVLGNTNQNRLEWRDPLLNKREACSPPHTIHKRKESQRVINDLDNVDSVPSNVQSSRQEALLYVFEDNEAVIKMIIKGKKPDIETCIPNPQSCS